MSDVISLPSNPYYRPRKITSLREIENEAQKESAAIALDVPYTPCSKRGTCCNAASCLAKQVSLNRALEQEKE